MIDEITISDFKELFPRNFPYLPYWEEGKVYFTDDVVYAEPNFYSSLKDENTDPVSVVESWKVVKADINDYVQDSDIEKAWQEAKVSFNEKLADNPDELRVIFLYLVAFYLAYDLTLTENGASGQVAFPATSVTVGSVSESYYVPKVYLENPVLSFYTRNGFGLKYLNLVYPKLVGNVKAVQGWSLP